MSTIREYASGNSYYDNSVWTQNNKSNSFLAGLSVSSEPTAFNLGDWSMIKSGTYRKLMKAYYAQEKADKTSSGDSPQKMTLMAGNTSAMEKSVRNLMKDSLWEKKAIKEKDEKTGEETTKEDYDWKSITKAVKSFIDDYNSVIDAAGEANSKEVLRNAVMMTKTTSVSERLLAKAGITVGKGNKLELDEDELKKADISTLKSLFTGHNSYASKMQYRANNMIHAASSAGAVYTSSGSYSSALSSIVSTKIDTKE